jgi:hypothetical protein
MDLKTSWMINKKRIEIRLKEGRLSSQSGAYLKGYKAGLIGEPKRSPYEDYRGGKHQNVITWNRGERQVPDVTNAWNRGYEDAIKESCELIFCKECFFLLTIPFLEINTKIGVLENKIIF